LLFVFIILNERRANGFSFIVEKIREKERGKKEIMEYILARFACLMLILR
jgi:hypothetical protein